MIGSTRRSLILASASLVCIASGVLSGCSGASDPAASPAAATSAATTSAAATSAAATSAAATSAAAATTGERFDRTVTVSVSGRKVTPSPDRVEVSSGDRVRILVTSDVANTVHVHGVDVEKDVQAGKQAAIDITMGDSGVYEVEMHHPALLLFQFVVR